VRRATLIAIAAAVLAGCGSEDRAKPSEVRDDPGLRHFQAMGCGSCHRLTSAGSTATIGPNLDNALRNRPRDEIAAIIVDPPEGSVMPRDFGKRLSAEQLDELVDFLVKSAN
jgi:mono/diheme cytochrome c family protein